VTRKNVSFASIGLAFVALPFSIEICHLALIVFLLVWLTEGKWSEKISMVRTNLVVKLIVAFSVLQLVGMIYTENVINGWLSVEKKAFLLFLPLSLATTFVKLDRKEINTLFDFFTAACIVGTFVCIANGVNEYLLLQSGETSADQFNYLHSDPAASRAALASTPWLMFSYIELADGIHMHPTYLSLYLAFCVVVLVYRILNRPEPEAREKILTKAIVVYFTIFIVCLSSRIVILSLLVLYVIIAIESFVIKRPLLTIVTLVGLIVILAATLFVNPIARYRNINELTSTSYSIQPNTTYKNSTEIRASLWWLGIQSLSSVNPLLGTGTGDVDDLIEAISDRYAIKNILGSYNPHNEFLYILLGNGAIGLILFLLFLAIPFRKAWIERDYVLMGFLFLIVSLCFTETILERQKGIVFFSLIFPLLAFQQKANLKPKNV
jgi:O-antigen ligase